MELARFYIEEKETGKVKQVTFYDSKYLCIEEVTTFELFKRFVRLLYFSIFRKNVLTRGEIYPTLKINAEDIYTEYNVQRVERNLAPIELSEIFDDEKVDTKEKATYIG